jgi:hypothetical protein
MARLKNAIEFLPEDQEWLALQNHVIDVTGKLIEDLRPHELDAVASVLTEREKSVFHKYCERKSYEAACANEGWADSKCDQTLGWMRYFMNTLRAISNRFAQIAYCHLENDYAATIQQIHSDLLGFLHKFPGAEWKSEAGEKMTARQWIMCNVSVVPPTDDGMELLQHIYDTLAEREEELKKPNQASPTGRVALPPFVPPPLPSGFTKKLFQVTIYHARAHKTEGYRVWADEAKNAEKRALAIFHMRFPNVKNNGWPFDSTTTEIRPGTDYWASHFKHGGTYEDKVY